MNDKKLPQWTIILIITALFLAGCGQQYVLKCDINAEGFGFGITGETGTLRTTSNNEVRNHKYDASGQESEITATVNRDLLFDDSQHKYHIEGTIKVNPITDELTYDITATGDTFGNSLQTCKKP